MDIEAYRIRNKMSVAELAKMLGVTDDAVYNYKYGKTKPSYKSVEKMLLDGAYLSEVFSKEIEEKVKETHGFQEQNPIKITNEDISKAMMIAAELLKKNAESDAGGDSV